MNVKVVLIIPISGCISKFKIGSKLDLIVADMNFWGERDERMGQWRLGVFWVGLGWVGLCDVKVIKGCLV
ncbi:unnamed protein product [Camellia sinensis]